MARKKTALAIVNRSFEYDSPIGEGLLQLAELTSTKDSACVITQTERDIKGELDAAGRGYNVQICACKAYTNSASGLLKRIFEAVFFYVVDVYQSGANEANGCICGY